MLTLTLMLTNRARPACSKFKDSRAVYLVFEMGTAPGFEPTVVHQEGGREKGRRG